MKHLEKRHVKHCTHSAYNSPVWPVHKADGQWCSTIEYRKLNRSTPLWTAAVLSITSVVTAIHVAAHPWVATLDVKDMIFMVPLREEDKPQFAFSWKGTQYTFNQIPQGISSLSYCPQCFRQAPQYCGGASRCPHISVYRWYPNWWRQ